MAEGREMFYQCRNACCAFDEADGGDGAGVVGDVVHLDHGLQDGLTGLNLSESMKRRSEKGRYEVGD